MIDENPNITIPEILPVLPLRNIVVFPNIIAPLIVGRERSIHTVEEAMMQDKLVALVTQFDHNVELPESSDLQWFGVVGLILRKLIMPEGDFRLIVQGLSRIKLNDIFLDKYILKAKVNSIVEKVRLTKKMKALMNNVRELFQQLVTLSPVYQEDVIISVLNIDEPAKLSDIIASELSIPFKTKEKLLRIAKPEMRLKKLHVILINELEMAELGSKIQSEAMTEIETQQKEYFLRQQLKAIHDELGEGEDRTQDFTELSDKITKAKMPEDIEKVARKELKRLKTMPPQAAEYSISRTYLESLISLPWSIHTDDSVDLIKTSKILDRDHYDLAKIKERILEYLAVSKLTGVITGTIFCFLGPPGVGKTSLGRSIASALNRKFYRISLGGMRDEAEIRGHRRTYIGALPGRIIQGIIKAGANNPVFMLDEIDKIGSDFRGDPAAALLEVLDPEQNNSFSDHYLEVPFDLSQVMFLTTANIIHTIPPALLDRMEILNLPGYSVEEKIMIARRHLIPKQLKVNGIKKKDIPLSKAVIKEIIIKYTHEAGVRNLERKLAAIFRKIARKIVENEPGPYKITKTSLKDFLGPQQFFPENAGKKSEIGVATGLAWTPYGGELLFIEATYMRGHNGLIMTGHLGEVMKESAQAALSYIRSQAEELNISPDFFKRHDIHIHVPAGAIPKDGPSAGVAISLALTSLLTQVPIYHNLAMTGEITLRGKVLPVGGVKEKIIAAHRSGIHRVILPRENKGDLEDLASEILEQTTFYFIEHLSDAFKLGLVKN